MGCFERGEGQLQWTYGAADISCGGLVCVVCGLCVCVCCCDYGWVQRCVCLRDGVCVCVLRVDVPEWEKSSSPWGLFMCMCVF